MRGLQRARGAQPLRDRPGEYLLTIAVEANLTGEMGQTVILPAAMRCQTELAANVVALEAAGVDANTNLLETVSVPVADLRSALKALTAAIDEEHAEDEMEQATYAVRGRSFCGPSLQDRRDR